MANQFEKTTLTSPTAAETNAPTASHPREDCTSNRCSSRIPEPARAGPSLAMTQGIATIEQSCQRGASCPEVIDPDRRVDKAHRASRRRLAISASAGSLAPNLARRRALSRSISARKPDARARSSPWSPSAAAPPR